MLFKLLPVAVVALIVFTPWGQALQLRAGQVFEYGRLIATSTTMPLGARDAAVRVDSSDAASRVDPPGLDARVLARGLAALRIFIGLIALLNGLAKVFGWHRVQLGPYLANLINRDDARFILDFEVFKNPANSSTGTRLPLVRTISQLMLDHWGLVGWALTVTEVVTGLLLVLGLLTRVAALIALGQHLFLALVYASSDRWLFEQPHEYVPLIILSIVPAGRVWGIDAWAAVRSGRGRARGGWLF